MKIMISKIKDNQYSSYIMDKYEEEDNTIINVAF